MYAVSGGTSAHWKISSNVARRLGNQLEGKPCTAGGSDLRVHSLKYQMFTYPDVVVVCEPLQHLPGRTDTVTDATVIVEVLSPSTKDYDRGEKFSFYQSLPSFADYLTVAQDSMLVQHHSRKPSGVWALKEYTSADDVIELTSIGCKLTLGTLYERVEF